VEILLTNKADVNGRDNNGSTPLDGAKANGQTKIANLLRQHGGRE
jgi:ankyrin repeat protein